MIYAVWDIIDKKEDKLIAKADDIKYISEKLHDLRYGAMIEALAECVINKAPIEEIRMSLNEAHDRYKLIVDCDTFPDPDKVL